jgi:hypothetical protein
MFAFAHWLTGCKEDSGGNPRNGDQMEGQWKQMKGRIKEKWGKPPGSDWDRWPASATSFWGNSRPIARHKPTPRG